MSKFHHEHYQPEIQNLPFNISHIKLLGKKHFDKTRHKALERRSHKKDIKCRHDYSDSLVAEFTTEIQSHNCGGNDYLSIEGVPSFIKMFLPRSFIWVILNGKFCIYS